MKDGSPVLFYCFRCGDQCEQRVFGGLRFQKDLSAPVVKIMIHQIRDPLEMVIKGISVHMTAVHDITDRYFFIGFLFQKLPEGSEEKFIRRIHKKYFIKKFQK